MDWHNLQIADIPRFRPFAFRVKMLYYSRILKTYEIRTMIPLDSYEINIRLSSQMPICRDAINGIDIRVPFPNVAWKLPGHQQIIRNDMARDTIAFAYPAETIKLFQQLGMMPDGINCKEFVMTHEIERLVFRFRKLVNSLYTPGVADEIDWTCFKLYRELLFFRETDEKTDSDTKSRRIQSIAAWFQLNFNEAFNLDEIARQNGFSRTAFFKEWKSVFKITPIQYLTNLKLDAARNLLLQTDLSIEKIIQEVHFANPTVFYRRFKKKFGLLPGVLRKQNEICWSKENRRNPDAKVPDGSNGTI